MKPEQVKREQARMAADSAEERALITVLVALLHGRDRAKLAGENKAAHLLTDVLNIVTDDISESLCTLRKRESDRLDPRP